MSKLSDEQANELARRATKNLMVSGLMPNGDDSMVNASVVHAVIEEFFDSHIGAAYIINMLNMIRELPIRSKR